MYYVATRMLRPEEVRDVTVHQLGSKDTTVREKGHMIRLLRRFVYRHPPSQGTTGGSLVVYSKEFVPDLYLLAGFPGRLVG